MKFWETLGIVALVVALLALGIFLFQTAWNLTIGFWWPRYGLSFVQAWAALFVGTVFSAFLSSPIRMK